MHFSRRNFILIISITFWSCIASQVASHDHDKDRLVEKPVVDDRKMKQLLADAVKSWVDTSQGGKIEPLPAPQQPCVWDALQLLKGSKSFSDSYPQIKTIPPAKFNCSVFLNAGFYSDIDYGCQVIRRCDPVGEVTSYLCPIGTVFNQITLTCDHWYNVNCSRSVDYRNYSNSRLYHPSWPLLDDCVAATSVPPTIAPSLEIDDFSNFINEASVNFYSAATNVNGSGSLLVSPLSILYASMLVYLGSDGKTKANFDNVFHFSGTQTAEINIQPFANALSMLNNASSSNSDTCNRKFELLLANAVYLQNDLNVSQAYLQAATNELQASVNRENFIDNPELARENINSWVEKKTHGKIQDLIPPGGVDSLTRAILVNALYFKAAWEKIFDKSSTRQDVFHLLDGTNVNVPFMNDLSGTYAYFDDLNMDAQYLEIPYNSNEASLLVILPRKVTGLRALEAALSNDTFPRLAASVEINTIDLSLPKFTISSSFDAKELLEEIGVTDMFSDNANLTRMVPFPPVYASKAFHKTFIDVNENGTEAAAATAIVISILAIPQIDNPVIFKADHPFFFAIRHNPTKLLLFVGRVESF